MPNDNGEGPITRAQARKNVKAWIDDPKHRIERGSKADRASIEDKLNDPEKQLKPEERHG